MLKLFIRTSCFVDMSQRTISAFFKPSQGPKRSLDNEDRSDSLETSKKAKNGHTEEDESSECRKQIIALSKINAALEPNIGLSWFKALSEEFNKDYFKEIGNFLQKERSKHIIYPLQKHVYFWTNTVKIHDVKVIILGQDPYHGPNQAHGLAFSVCKETRCPPSLKNIFKELANDIQGFKPPTHGYLYGWASQGVLLLNTTLTVRAGKPNSHKGIWNQFTDAVIKWIDHNLPNSVFMLWGKNAQEKLSLITKEKHLVLVAAHPSPFSADRGFFGCRHFSKANEYLEKHNKKPIDWKHLP